jgi:hypothetical protein
VPTAKPWALGVPKNGLPHTLQTRFVLTTCLLKFTVLVLLLLLLLLLLLFLLLFLVLFLVPL